MDKQSTRQHAVIRSILKQFANLWEIQEKLDQNDEEQEDNNETNNEVSEGLVKEPEDFETWIYDEINTFSYLHLFGKVAKARVGMQRVRKRS